jgi:SNF2 family DNA or RNA helicase
MICEESESGLRLHALNALDLERLSEGLGEFDADASWRNILSKLHNSFDGKAAELPDGFRATLRDYQLKGYQWMQRLASVGLGACLADDMGLGKTVQSIAVLLARAGDGPSLVLAPTSVCSNWETEVEAFAPQLKLICLREGDRGTLLRSASNFDVVICTYGLLSLEAERLQQVQWGTVILDEGQNIKNSLTKRSQAVMDLKAGFRIVLSGTPIENHLAELWNLFRFLNPGLLGTIEQFRKRFQDPIERNNDSIALDRLKRIVSPFLLRRIKNKVLHELPPITEIVLELEPSIAERTILETLRRQYLEDLDDNKDKTMQVLAALMRLRRACCNVDLIKPGLNIPSSKLEAFLDLVEELREGDHRALVFSQFVDHLTILRKALDERGTKYQYLDGSTSVRKRAEAVAAFQAGQGD